MKEAFIIERPPLCACGCGVPVKWNKWKNRWNTYLLGGHSCRMPENRRKISEGVKLWASSPAIREGIRQNLRGSKRATGHKVSEEARQKIREARARQIINTETREKISKALKGKEKTREHCKRLSKSQSRLWKNQTYKEKQLRASFKGRAIRPNKPEVIIMNTLNKLYPKEYKYTGNGSLWINGKNPDFANVNGQKKLIEFFGEYFHRGGTDEEKERKSLFKSFGYDTLIIWENELKNMKALNKKIKRFCKP